ncbi:UNVERIFIED_CONTAM: hypothetical protein NCL1_41882 [Trichonephila clavipes]
MFKIDNILAGWPGVARASSSVQLYALEDSPSSLSVSTSWCKFLPLLLFVRQFCVIEVYRNVMNKSRKRQAWTPK